MEDLSDNEREEQLRRFWSENWLWIVGGIALGLGAVAGWQFWQRTQQVAAETDERTYLAVLDSLSRNDPATALKKADDLRAMHPKSPYADQSDLALARADIGNGKLDDATRRLRMVADSSRDPQLRLIAQTRLARVLAEQGKYDDALKLLDVEKAGAFAPLFHDIRGDVLAVKGDTAAARQQYESALAAASAAGSTGEPIIDVQYVRLKLDALPPAAPAAAASKATPKPAGSGAQP